MKIHEYQAKQLLKQYGVPVPEGQVVAATPAEVREVAQTLGRRINSSSVIFLQRAGNASRQP